MKTIGGIFGRSPYGPVHEMMLKVEQCVGQMPALLAALVAADWPALEAVTRQIDTLEGQADDIKREIRKHLSTSLFSSVERSETLELVHNMDDIADACHDVARLVGLRRTALPAELGPGCGRMGAALARAAAKMADVTAKLSGAAGAKSAAVPVREVLAELEEVARLEFECDEEQHRLQQALFAMENRLSTMDIIFLMNIIRDVGRVGDEMENAAESLARILGSR